MYKFCCIFLLLIGILQAQVTQQEEQDFGLQWKLKELKEAQKKAQEEDFAKFYQQVHEQTLKRNFVRFRDRILVSRDGYHLLLPQEKEFLNGQYALVLVFSKIDWFIYFNEQNGDIGIATEVGSFLQFDIKYYEALEDIGIGGKIHAMCVLPYFDKCILLGYEMF